MRAIIAEVVETGVMRDGRGLWVILSITPAGGENRDNELAARKGQPFCHRLRFPAISGLHAAASARCAVGLVSTSEDPRFSAVVYRHFGDRKEIFLQVGWSRTNPADAHPRPTNLALRGSVLVSQFLPIPTLKNRDLGKTDRSLTRM